MKKSYSNSFLVDLLIVAYIFIVFTSCNNSVSENWESQLLIPNPQWEKFVKVETGATLLGLPSTDCNVLLQNTEDDCCLPVIAESNGWYKVLCYTPDSHILSREAYVKDTNCKEIIPERITHDVLANNNIYVLGGNSIYKNLCIKSSLIHAEVGELANEYCITFSNRFDQISFWNDRYDEKPYVIHERKREDGFSSYSITIFGYEFDDGEARIKLMRSFTEEQISEFVATFIKTIPEANHSRSYFYFFPSVSGSKLVKFHVANEIASK